MTLGAQDVLVIIAILLLSHVHGSNTVCNQTFESAWGRIRSPNYPKPYPAGVSCHWHINMANLTNVTGVTLFIKHFSTQIINSAALFEEELLIYAETPSSANATPIVYNGRDSVYTWHHNQLWLQFSAADNGTLTRATGPSLGFDILFSAVIQGTFCEDPGSPLNAIRTGNNFTVGSYVSYYCNHGSRLSGNSLIICLLNENENRPTWSEEPPSCTDTCVTPTLKNGSVSYVNLKVNSTVSFLCDPPYRLTGNDSLVCTLNNEGQPSWNGVFPSCELSTCSQLEVLTDTKGAVVNPGYGDGIVKAAVTCQWKIVVRTGFVIQLSFRYFDLPSEGRVEVADTGTGRELLLTASGGSHPPNVTSSTNQVEILYHGPQNNSNAFRGFYLQYMMTPVYDDLQQQGHSVPTGGTGVTGSLWTIQTTLTPPSTKKPLPTKTEDDNGVDTTKIAIGVSIPAVLLLAILLGLYLWYRKKYPVRMIIGREFAKFTNPEYNQKGNSTLTLVRDDAEEFFQTASRATSHVSLVRDVELGPRFVEVDMRKGEDSEQHRVIDQDEEDRELVKRKSYLFTNVNMFDETDKGEDSSSESRSETRSVGERSQGSKTATDVQFKCESETESAGEASQSSKEPESVTVVEKDDSVALDTDQSVDQSYTEAVNNFNSKFRSEFPRKVSVDILLERSRDRRAFTNEEASSRRFSIDTTLSVRGRSLSAKTPSEVSKEATKLTALLSLSTVKDSTEDQIGNKSRKQHDNLQEQQAHEASVNSRERSDSDRQMASLHKDGENEQSIAEYSAAEEGNDSCRGDSLVNEVPEPSVTGNEKRDVTEDAASNTSGDHDQSKQPDPAGDTSETVISDVTQGELCDYDEHEVKSENVQDPTGDHDESELTEQSVTENLDKYVTQGSSTLTSEDGVEDLGKRDIIPEQSATSNVHKIHGSSRENEDEPETVPSTKSEPVCEVNEGRADTLESDTTDSNEQSMQAGNPFEDEESASVEFSKVITTQGDKDTRADESDSDEMDIDGAIAQYKGSVSDSGQNEEGEREENKESAPESEDESESESSTTSHVSASYNFANSGGESEENESDHQCVGMAVGNSSDQTQSSPDMSDIKVNGAENSTPSDNNISGNTAPVSKGTDDLNESKSKHENVSIGSSINLDTSSISSFDTSVDLSISSNDSPLPRHRLPELSQDQPRKLAAPVFNADDDDDNNPSNTSSSESDDEGARSRPRQPLTSTMSGIQEESDSDEGRSRSYDVSGLGKQESDSDEEDGIKFTDEDLLAGLSEDASGKQPELTSGVFVFSDKEDDDGLDV